MKVTYKLAVELASRTTNPIIFTGGRGIGKSQIPRYLQKHLASRGIQKDLLEIRLSQMADVGELSGLPKFQKSEELGRLITRFVPLEAIAKACDRPTILFFDEPGRATQDIAQAMFQIADSRRFYNHILHPGTQIIAADNGDVGERRYLVRPFEPAEMDRWEKYTLSPTVDEWLAWANESGVVAAITAFIREQPKWLDYDGDFVAYQKYPSPRSWERLSNDIKAFPDLTGDLLPIKAAGMVGDEAGNAFAQFFYEWQRKRVTYEDVASGKARHDELRKLSNTEHLDIIDQFDRPDIMDLVKRHPRLVQNLVSYVVDVLPVELGRKMWAVMTRRMASIVPEAFKTRAGRKTMEDYIRFELSESIVGGSL